MQFATTLTCLMLAAATSAFAPVAFRNKASSTTLFSSPDDLPTFFSSPSSQKNKAFYASPFLAGASPSTSPFKKESEAGFQNDGFFLPLNAPTERIEGGETVRTWIMPKDAERVQMMFKTKGRPLKAQIEMWQGPIRRTHFLDMDFQDGSKTPYTAILKFKKGPQVLKVRTKGPEFPMEACVVSPDPAKAAALAANTEALWEANEKTLIQGGSTIGGLGAVTTFAIPAETNQVQVIFWSKNVGSRSTKAIIEVIQGPYNLKQVFDMQLSGSSQPYHAVYQTPGVGVTLRIVNQNYMEFPFEVAVIPYDP